MFAEPVKNPHIKKKIKGEATSNVRATNADGEEAAIGT